MFGVIEASKDELHIQEYSISQTSLEQIFNQFASQQEEETGTATGLVAPGGSNGAIVGGLVDEKEKVQYQIPLPANDEKHCASTVC
jgi:hypothetical protein